MYYIHILKLKLFWTQYLLHIFYTCPKKISCTVARPGFDKFLGPPLHMCMHVRTWLGNAFYSRHALLGQLTGFPFWWLPKSANRSRSRCASTTICLLLSLVGSVTCSGLGTTSLACVAHYICAQYLSARAFWREKKACIWARLATGRASFSIYLRNGIKLADLQACFHAPLWSTHTCTYSILECNKPINSTLVNVPRVHGCPSGT